MTGGPIVAVRHRIDGLEMIDGRYLNALDVRHRIDGLEIQYPSHVCDNPVRHRIDGLEMLPLT